MTKYCHRFLSTITRFSKTARSHACIYTPKALNILLSPSLNVSSSQLKTTLNQPGSSARETSPGVKKTPASVKLSLTSLSACQRSSFPVPASHARRSTHKKNPALLSSQKGIPFS